MRAKLIVAWSISIAAAIALARGTTRTASAPRSAAASSCAPPLPVARAAIAIDDLRRVVREELAPRPVSAPPDRPDEVRVEAVDRSADVRDRALVTVNAAITAGRWTESDRLTLRTRVGGLAREDIALVLGQLVPAVNEGRIRVEAGGLVF